MSRMQKRSAPRKLECSQQGHQDGKVEVCLLSQGLPHRSWAPGAASARGQDDVDSCDPRGPGLRQKAGGR